MVRWADRIDRPLWFWFANLWESELNFHNLLSTNRSINSFGEGDERVDCIAPFVLG